MTIILHPADIAANNGFDVAGGSWTDVLDSNDGDASYAHDCCGPAGSNFYVDLDDPAGLDGATIESLTVVINTRYVEGPWPGAAPYAGSLDIGYRTGTSTIWNGSTTTDTSGSYNLISSLTYNADSDGGLLDPADLTNLQIAVRRNVSGSYQLRVTEMVVEVVYTP